MWKQLQAIIFPNRSNISLKLKRKNERILSQSQLKFPRPRKKNIIIIQEKIRIVMANLEGISMRILQSITKALKRLPNITKTLKIHLKIEKALISIKKIPVWKECRIEIL